MGEEAIGVWRKLQNEERHNLCYCMEHSPSWEADSHSGSQDISQRVHKNPPLDYILIHLNPVHTLTPYF